MFERVIEQGVNRLLAMDPSAAGRIGAYAGKRVELRLTGIPRTLLIEFHADGQVQVDSLPPGSVNDADAVLSGSPFAFARAAMAGDAAPAPASLGIHFEGDVGLAQGVSNLLRDLDIDFEDELARAVGQTPAHHLGRFFRGVRSFMEDTGDRVGTNVGEFLREESGQTVAPEELEKFLDDVDTLRADLERLDRRVSSFDNRESTL